MNKGKSAPKNMEGKGRVGDGFVWPPKTAEDVGLFLDEFAHSAKLPDDLRVSLKDVFKTTTGEVLVEMTMQEFMERMSNTGLLKDLFYVVRSRTRKSASVPASARPDTERDPSTHSIRQEDKGTIDMPPITAISHKSNLLSIHDRISAECSSYLAPQLKTSTVPVRSAVHTTSDLKFGVTPIATIHDPNPVVLLHHSPVATTPSPTTHSIATTSNSETISSISTIPSETIPVVVSGEPTKVVIDHPKLYAVRSTRTPRVTVREAINRFKEGKIPRGATTKQKEACLVRMAEADEGWLSRYGHLSLTDGYERALSDWNNLTQLQQKERTYHLHSVRHSIIEQKEQDLQQALEKCLKSCRILRRILSHGHGSDKCDFVGGKWLGKLAVRQAIDDYILCLDYYEPGCPQWVNVENQLAEIATGSSHFSTYNENTDRTVASMSCDLVGHMCYIRQDMQQTLTWWQKGGLDPEFPYYSYDAAFHAGMLIFTYPYLLQVDEPHILLGKCFTNADTMGHFMLGIWYWTLAQLEKVKQLSYLYVVETGRLWDLAASNPIHEKDVLFGFNFRRRAKRALKHYKPRIHEAIYRSGYRYQAYPVPFSRKKKALILSQPEEDKCPKSRWSWTAQLEAIKRREESKMPKKEPKKKNPGTPYTYEMETRMMELFHVFQPTTSSVSHKSPLPPTRHLIRYGPPLPIRPSRTALTT